MMNQPGLKKLVDDLKKVGLKNIPPVTLAVLGLNVYLYLFPAAPLMQVCVSLEQVFEFKGWRRLLLSPIHHGDSLHLYGNMAFFLLNGRRMEKQMGGAWFLYLLSVFSLLTGLVYLGLQAVLTVLLQDQSYSTACAVGFSGVLFALKILSHWDNPDVETSVMGYKVPNRYATWVELIMIQITSPRTSFIGHLAGILVGLLYTAGPLKAIMEKRACFKSKDAEGGKTN